jgi:hypothetical protein
MVATQKGGEYATVRIPHRRDRNDSRRASSSSTRSDFTTQLSENHPSHAPETKSIVTLRGWTMATVPVLVLPGSGCTPTRECNFYAWFGDVIASTGRYEPRMRDMPDPHVCRERVWMPFIEEELGASPECVVVGHSSGAVAALRLAERRRLRGIVVIAGYDSDLGDASERASGYFDRPFRWDDIKANCGFIACVGGARDSLVDIDIQRRVALECLGLEPGKTGAEWLELPNRDHFFTPPFPELVDLLDRNVAATAKSSSSSPVDTA